MLTQAKLDEMVTKAEQRAQEFADGWYKSFLNERHPDNMPPTMARQPEQPQMAQGMVNDGTIR